MKVERALSVNELNKYNKVNKVTKSSEVSQIKDTIEITKEGKILSGYVSEPLVDKSARIQQLKEQIESGTYNVDPKLTAKSMIDAMK